MKISLNNKIPKLVPLGHHYTCSSRCCLNKRISHEEVLCNLVDDLPCRFDHGYVLTENNFDIFRI